MFIHNLSQPVRTGLILAGGCQVMLGYLSDDEPRTGEYDTASIIELDGVSWFKTGDIGRLDADGFLTVVDRATRFAKIGNVSVSLTAVEERLSAALATIELEAIAIALPDGDSGEKIIALLVTDLAGSDIHRQLQAAAIDPLLMPAEIYLIDAVPKLGSGKVNYVAARELAMTLT